MNVIMNRIETLEELVETYKKCPYKVETYEFDGTGYALLIIEINKMLKENQELKKQLDELQTLYNNMFKCHCNRVQVETLLEQQKKFIEYLKNKEKEFDMMGDTINSGACLGILREYKEIIGGKYEEDL